MKTIDKKDMQLMCNKTNAANVTSTMLNLGRVFTTLLIYTFGFGMVFLLIAVNANERSSGLFTAGLISLTLFAVIVIYIVTTHIKFKQSPNLIFIGKKMYIKASKEHYLELLADELDNYKFASLIYNKLLAQKKIANTPDSYAMCRLWGKVILECQGTAYCLKCSDLRKARHYIDGFKLGLDAEENQYVNDNLKKQYEKIMYLLIPMTVGIALVLAGCIIDNVWWLSIIGGVIAFAALTSIIIHYAKHYKEYRNAAIETFNKVLCPPPINCNKYGNVDNGYDDSRDTTKNDFF